MKVKLKEFLLINFGIVLVSGGMYFFLMPNNLATGGANGLSIVFNHFIPVLPVGLIMVVINLILFVIAFILIGNGFGIKTIYTSLAVSLTVLLLEKLIPLSKPFTDEIMIELIVGVLISGIGMGFVFNQNASTGGTDISAKILNKFLNIELGRAVFLSDIIITILAAFAFGLKLSLFAVVGVLLNSFVIDHVIEGFNARKEVTIISDRIEDLRKYILEEMDRGFTFYKGQGGYTFDKKDIIVVVISKREFVKLRNHINQIDSDAFVTVKNTHEVYGYGFKNF